MGKTMGVLIIGTGWVSGEHIRAYLKNPHTENRGLCDIQVERAEKTRIA